MLLFKFKHCLTLSPSQLIHHSPDWEKASVKRLKSIYNLCFPYRKVPIIVTSLLLALEIQLNIFTEWVKNNQMSYLMDQFNKYYCSGTIRMASEGLKKRRVLITYLVTEFGIKLSTIALISGYKSIH
jgi:hypothetical protein